MSQKRVAVATVKPSASRSAKKSVFVDSSANRSALSARSLQFSSMSAGSQISGMPGLIAGSASLQSIACEAASRYSVGRSQKLEMAATV